MVSEAIYLACDRKNWKCEMNLAVGYWLDFGETFTWICAVASSCLPHLRPPHSQCFVHAVATDYGPCDQDVLFFSFMHKMARLNVLLGASVVAEDPQNRIPVTVMNNSNLPIKLFAGIRIGELSPVKVDDQSAKINTVSENPPPPPLPPKKGPVAVNWIIVKCHLQRRRNEQPSWMITAMCSPTMTQKLAALTEPTSTFIPRLRCLSL